MIQHLSRRAALSSLSGLFLAACGSSDDEPGSEPGSREPSDPNALESGYGPLVEKDGAKIWLPEGFRYVALGAAGSSMSDGNRTPGAHDGMVPTKRTTRARRVRSPSSSSTPRRKR